MHGSLSLRIRYSFLLNTLHPLISGSDSQLCLKVTIEHAVGENIGLGTMTSAATAAAAHRIVVEL